MFSETVGLVPPLCFETPPSRAELGVEGRSARLTLSSVNTEKNKNVTNKRVVDSI